MLVNGRPVCITNDFFVIYLEDHDRNETISKLYSNALHMMEKAKIVNFIDEAMAIYNVLEKNDFFSGIYDGFDDDLITLYHILASYMNLLVDEIFIGSALDIYCSAILIEKGYVVHVITGDRRLKKEQENRPVRISELTSIDETMIKDITLNINKILKNPDYFELTELESSEDFISISRKRNEVHFHLINAKEIEKSYITSVFNLYMKLLDKTKSYEEDVFLKDNLLRQKNFRLTKRK